MAEKKTLLYMTRLGAGYDMKHGADASAADADGFTPLHLAAGFSGDVERAEMLEALR